MKTKLSTLTFFYLSFLCIIFNEPRFFSTVFQFTVYCIPILYGLLLILTELNKKQIKFSPIIPFYFISFFYLLSAIIMVIHKDILTLGLGHLFYYILICICFIDKEDRNITEEIISIMKMLTIAAIVVSFLSISFIPYVEQNIEKFSWTDKNTLTALTVIAKEPSRLVGMLGHPNKTGNFCAICIIGSELILFSQNQKKWKAVSIVSILLSSLTILLTGSRTAMLMTALFTIIFIILLFCTGLMKEKNTLKTLLLFIGIMLIFCILALVFLVATNKVEFFLNHIIRTDSMQSGSGRTWIRAKAFEISKENRLIGVSRKYLTDIIGVDAHNTYYEILATAGVPALILYLCFIFYSIYSSSKLVILYKRKNSLSLIFAIFLFSATVAVLAENYFEPMMFALFFTPGVFGYYITSTAIKLWNEEKTIHN